MESKPGQRVLISLRNMIASGALPAGVRLAEIQTAQSLGVSRTPVRLAFRTLEQEGLLVRCGARGYMVPSVEAQDLANAVEVRGVLEGLAARQATERGLPAASLAVLEQCLERGDALFAKGHIVADDMQVYHELNMTFHQVIVEASGNAAVATALSRNDHLPFASSSALAFDNNNLAGEWTRFNFAHLQHHAIVDAMRTGQSARAEALMREHANATLRYAEIFTKARAGQRPLEVLHGDADASKTRTD
ncbi:GntR family transcriptional regulator [Pseudoxanthomonas sp. JBR18]|uniref:GntR family transcriptional regulator n=1 Tax=Pseudoxanthomonas sp. JBR18 TaxID=2969308 RepID=UPI002305A916|nr:GntR family transcriptional regulator [Pseudoxanthomonas sp. JBR18]WCE05546.1 GntR family transcriptional regulator [Pseudoxanthomonas sp. JBR18]